MGTRDRDRAPTHCLAWGDGLPLSRSHNPPVPPPPRAQRAFQRLLLPPPPSSSSPARCLTRTQPLSSAASEPGLLCSSLEPFQTSGRQRCPSLTLRLPVAANEPPLQPLAGTSLCAPLPRPRPATQRQPRHSAPEMLCTWHCTLPSGSGWLLASSITQPSPSPIRVPSIISVPTPGCHHRQANQPPTP